MRRPDLYGTIDANCDVPLVVEDAYNTAKFLCEQYYLGAPQLRIVVNNGKPSRVVLHVRIRRIGSGLENRTAGRVQIGTSRYGWAVSLSFRLVEFLGTGH